MFNNLETQSQIEKDYPKENSFYDVFETDMNKIDLLEYKKRIGIPIITINNSEVKRILSIEKNS